MTARTMHSGLTLYIRGQIWHMYRCKREASQHIRPNESGSPILVFNAALTCFAKRPVTFLLGMIVQLRETHLLHKSTGIQHYAIPRDEWDYVT